jgi:ubiquinone/menaquinone biosynthesis C-methylase UbiE
MILSDRNEEKRQKWLARTLAEIPSGSRILDAGAGELKNKIYCEHLQYVSQDFCQYDGKTGLTSEGLHVTNWGGNYIDLVCDVTNIPVPDGSFDAILCSEVLEHVPDPTLALDEFTRLLKKGGILVLTAPFASMVHMAPYYFYSGFSKYWYEHHLKKRGLIIQDLSPHGDWYSMLAQEISRLGGLERSAKNWIWPLSYVYAFLGILYFKLRTNIKAYDLATLGWHCVAIKE